MGAFKNELFGCFGDVKLCIISYLVPCFVFGKTAEKVGESCGKCGFCFMMPIGNIISWLNIRGKIREANGIEGTTCNDIVMLLFCPFCSLVQMAAEVDALGMAIERE